MADFVQLKTAFQNFAQAALPGLPVVWMGDPRGWEAKMPAKCLLSIGNIEEVGIDFWAPGPGDGEGAVENYRQASCMFRIVSRSYPGNTQAEYFCERLRGHLRVPASRALLSEVPIGVIECRPTVAYPASLDNREESVALLELRFAFKFTDASLETTGGDWIESISGDRIVSPPGDSVEYTIP